LFEGHNSAVLWVPAEDRVVIALGNSEVVPAEEMTANVGRLAYGLEAAERVEPRPVPVRSEEVARLGGQWVMTDGDQRRVLAALGDEQLQTVRVARVGLVDQHASLSLGKQPRWFYPLGDDRYFFKDRPQSEARLVRGRTAADDRLVLIRDETELRYRRMPPQVASR
jgi:hypothetical protein